MGYRPAGEPRSGRRSGCEFRVNIDLSCIGAQLTLQRSGDLANNTRTTSHRKSEPVRVIAVARAEEEAMTDATVIEEPDISASKVTEAEPIPDRWAAVQAVHSTLHMWFAVRSSIVSSSCLHRRFVPNSLSASRSTGGTR